MPDPASVQTFIGKQYPEADALSLYTHVWMRVLTTVLEDSVERFLGEHKISSGRFLLMMLLEVRGSGAKPSELAQSLGVTQATITGLLNGLEQSGYVVRADCVDDGRACVVALTETGLTFTRDVRIRFHQWLDSQIYSGLSPDEKLQLIALLEKLMCSLKPGANRGRAL